MERSAKCAPQPGNPARSLRRVRALRAFQKKQKANDFPGRTDWPPTLATHTAMSDPGGPAGPAVPPPAPWRRTKPSVWSVWSAVRWVGVRMRWCKRMQAHGWRQFGSKFRFRKYERAGERHESAQAVGLGFGGRACIRLSERASLQPPADDAWPLSSIRIISWPSQWRFQTSAQIHPKFELASQSVVFTKAHPKI